MEPQATAPTPEQDARVLVRQLREELSHPLNLERTLRAMSPETRRALHAVTRKARSDRRIAADLLAREDEPETKGRVWRRQ